jgi:transcriptional regulator with XRE-family HTH domain
LIALPEHVARLILFHTYHPVKAWRVYVNLSIEHLAECLDISVDALEAIEASNAHLEKNMLARLADAFKLDPSLLAIRHMDVSKTHKLSFNV